MNELQRFPVLRKHMDGVVGIFLREGLEPSETMIGHIIEMEMDYINTSHPNFIGGSKAVESALEQVRSTRLPVSLPRQRDGVDSDRLQASERSQKSRANLARPGANGIVPDQGVRLVADGDRLGSSGNASGSSWGISSIFGGSESRAASREKAASKVQNGPIHTMEHSFGMIQLKEPPTILRPSDTPTEHEAVEIAVTKLLLRSYYDIVRKNVEDTVPKAIMHFLVNHTKRELHNVLIRELYRDDIIEEMLREPEEVAMKRKRTRETLRVLQQAFRTLDELPLEAETVAKGYSLGSDPTGLPKIHGLPTSYYAAGPEYSPSHSTPKISKSRKSHSGEQPLPLHSYSDANGSGHHYGL